MTPSCICGKSADERLSAEKQLTLTSYNDCLVLSMDIY